MLGDLNYRCRASPDEVLSLVAESVKKSPYGRPKEPASRPDLPNDASSHASGEVISHDGGGGKAFYGVFSLRIWKVWW